MKTPLGKELLEACKVAYEASIHRSMGRSKWTMRDQNAHDALKKALVSAIGDHAVNVMADNVEIEFSGNHLIKAV